MSAAGPLLRPDLSRPFASAVAARMAGVDRREDAHRALADAERAVGVELIHVPGHSLARGSHRPMSAGDLPTRALVAAALDPNRWKTKFRLDPDAEADIGPSAAVRLLVATGLVLEGRCFAGEFVLRLSGAGDVWVLGHREWANVVASWANRVYPRANPWTYVDFSVCDRVVADYATWEGAVLDVLATR